MHEKYIWAVPDSLLYCEYKKKEAVRDCPQYCNCAPPIVSRAVATELEVLLLLARCCRYFWLITPGTSHLVLRYGHLRGTDGGTTGRVL